MTAEILKKHPEDERDFYEIESEISPEKLRRDFELHKVDGRLRRIYYTVSKDNFKIYISDWPHYEKMGLDTDFAGSITFERGGIYSFPISGTFPNPPKEELPKILAAIAHYLQAQGVEVDIPIKAYNEGVYSE